MLMYILTAVDERMPEIDLNSPGLILPAYFGVWGVCLVITRISFSLTPPRFQPRATFAC